MFILESKVSKPVIASLPALGPWAPPAERGPSLESIYRISLTVDICEGNERISFFLIISPQPVGAPQKEKNPELWAHAHAVCPLVKTALKQATIEDIFIQLFFSATLISEALVVALVEVLYPLVTHKFIHILNEPSCSYSTAVEQSKEVQHTCCYYPAREAEYCDERVCLSVSVCICVFVSSTIKPNFCACYSGSVLLCRRTDMLRISSLRMTSYLHIS